MKRLISRPSCTTLSILSRSLYHFAHTPAGSTAAAERSHISRLSIACRNPSLAGEVFSKIIGHRILQRDTTGSNVTIDGGIGARIEFQDRRCPSLPDEDASDDWNPQPLYPLPVIATSNLRRVLRQAHAKGWTVAGGGGVRLSDQIRAAREAQQDYRIGGEAILRGGGSMRRAYGDKRALIALHEKEPTAAALVDPDGAVYFVVHAFARSPLLALRVPARDPSADSDFYHSCLGLVQEGRAPGLVAAAAATTASAAPAGADQAGAASPASALDGLEGQAAVSLCSSEGAAGRSRLELFAAPSAADGQDPLHSVVRELLALEAEARTAARGGGAVEAASAMEESRRQSDASLHSLHPSRLLEVGVTSASAVYGRVSRREEVEVDAESFRDGQDRVFMCIDHLDLALQVEGEQP